MRSVAIIGGGAAGLCMARYLSQKSRLFNFVIYEKGKEIGGTWVYDNNISSLKYGYSGIQNLKRSEETHTSMYKNLRHFTKPNIPDIPGITNFKGSVQHSHLYRVADQYRGKTVLVLGGSASGRDIAVEISRFAKEVLLCHRGEFDVCKLPRNVKERPQIKMIADDGGVVLNDATQCTVDGIVFCTGYLYDFPFLHESCGVKVERNRVSPLYKQIFNVNNPSMAFIGVPSIVCPFQLFSMQARWVLKVLEGTAMLPSKKEMLQDCEEELRSRLEAGIPEKYFHRFDKGEDLEYFATLSKEADVEPIKVVLEKMFLKVKQERERNLLYYREKEYVIKNDEEFEIISVSKTV